MKFDEQFPSLEHILPFQDGENVGYTENQIMQYTRDIIKIKEALEKSGGDKELFYQELRL